LKKKTKKKRLSDYDIAYAILSYLVRLKENQTHKVSAKDSAHNISKKAPEFINNTQRPQRIMEMLEDLEMNEFVQSEKIGNYLYWEITDEGFKWYKDIAKQFMTVFMK
jgi:predicted transcriptional regulator